VKFYLPKRGMDMVDFIIMGIVGFVVIEVIVDVIAYCVSSKVRRIVNGIAKRFIGTK